MMQCLRSADMWALALGAAFLGCGGGGSPRLGMYLARHALDTCGPVRLLDYEELSGPAVVVGMIGAPNIDEEKLPSGDELLRAVDCLAPYVDGDCRAVGALEIGGSNGMFAVVAAARMRLPLLDADTMGRAFPLLSMSSWFLPEHSGRQFVAFADAVGHTLVIPGEDGEYVDKIAELMTRHFGGVAAVAIGPLLPRVHGQRLNLGSFTTAHRIGVALEHSSDIYSLYESLQEWTACELFVGKVSECVKQFQGHYPYGMCTLETTYPNWSHIRLDFQNEFLLLSRDGQSIATVPDIISVIDLSQLQPITPSELAYGMEIAVVTMPAPRIWQEDRRRRRVGPATFGYEWLDGYD
ncbi:DUF917 domain-containing protein [Alicyclobacillus macrosporangiidus]|uniref:DUF917 domain-containing protein n=1 Tax=Alicyclobacillus macrosporangiidus TaxID=392015 RepID=UPI00054E80E9|nr:DUF917 domain-containing protein [Alicyclobacillus macrosporangiidus]